MLFDGLSVSPLIDALKPLIYSPRGISSFLLKASETLIGLGGPSLAKLCLYSSRQGFAQQPGAPHAC